MPHKKQTAGVQLKTLQREHHRFDQFLSLLPDVSLLGFDEEMGLEYLNPVAEKLLGGSLDEVRSQFPGGVTEHPVLKILLRTDGADKHDRSFHDKEILLPVNGKDLCLNTSLLPLKDEAGQADGYLLVIKDITKNMQATSDLKQSEERYQAIFEQVQEAIILVDNNQRILNFNDRAAENLGYSREEFKKLSVSDIEAIENSKAIQERMQRIMDTGSDSFETRHRSKSGDIQEVLVNASYLRLQGQDCFLSVFTNLTEQHQAERDLRDSEERLRLAISAHNGCLWEWDAGQETMLWNEEYESLWGKRPAEFHTNRDWWLECIHPDDRKRTHASLLAAMGAEPTDTWSAEYRFRRPNGLYAHVLDRAHIRKGEKGKIIGAIGARLDISELVRARSDIDRFFEMSMDLTCVASLDGYFKRISHSFQRILNYSEQELLETPFLELVHPDDRRLTYDAMHKLNDNQQVVGFENRYQAKDGSFRWLQWNSVPDTDAGLIFTIARDVTRQRQTAQQLQENEERFRQLAETLPQVVWLTDWDNTMPLDWSRFQVLYVSPIYEQIWGRSTQALYTDPMDWAQGIHPDDRDRVAHAFKEGVENNNYDCRYRVLREDGSIRYIHDRSRTIYNSEGQVYRLSGIAEDITEHIEAQQVIEASEVRYRELIDSMSNGVAVFEAIEDGSDFIVRDLNPAGARMIDVNRESTCGRKVMDVWPSIVPTGLLKVFQRVYRSGRSEHHPVTRYTNHRLQSYIKYCVYRLPDRSLVAVYEDLSGSILADEQIRIRDRAITATSNGILITDADGDMPIVYCNPAFETISGYQGKEILGQNCRFLQKDDTEQPGIRQLRSALLKQETTKVLLRNYRKDGAMFWNQLAIAPVADERGRVTHFVGIQQDITDQVRLERQLQQAYKMEAIGLLTGGIAHDFNNILGTIMGFSELAHDNLETLPADKLRQYLQTILETGSRGRDLVSQMLTYSRTDKQQSPEVIDAGTEIKEISQMLRSALPASIEMELDIQDPVPPITIEPVKFQQVLMNLCVNARDAMQGRGSMRIGLDYVQLENVECSACHEVFSGHWVQLTVVDSGPGIATKHLIQIFDPFFTTKEPGEGSGMGLSIVHSISDSLGGHILIDSAPGKGSTFRVLFPPSDKGPGTRTLPSPKLTTIDGQNHSVLVVDDEQGITGYLGELLRQNGYQVTLANSGAAAKALLCDQMIRIDALITDQTMPQISGLELVVFTRETRPQIPIMMCSGYGNMTDDDQTAMPDIDAFFQKPIDSRELLETLSMLLNR